MSRNDGDNREGRIEKLLQKQEADRQAKAEEAARATLAEEDRKGQYKTYQDLYNDTASTYGIGDLKLLDENASTEDIQKATNDLNAYRDKYGTQTRAESDAAKLASAAATQQAQAQEIAAKNTGLQSSRAGSLSSNNTYGNVYKDSVQGLSNQAVMTQADWLEKMGYVSGLQQQADNMEKGATLNTTAAAFTGVSDENEKVEPNRDGKLPESDEYDAMAALKETLNDFDGYVDDDDVLKQVAQLETVSYKYKHPDEPGEDNEVHKAGFTAQSLQKIPLFKKCVIDDDGTLKINLDLLEEIIVNKVMPAIKAAIGE